MASVILHVSIGGVYVPLLSIPLGDCHRFALAPLRWLRFLGYCIYGSPGSISATAGGPPVAYLSAIQGGDYYFTSPGIQIHSLWRLIFRSSTKQRILGSWTLAASMTEPLILELPKVEQGFVLIW